MKTKTQTHWKRYFLILFFIVAFPSFTTIIVLYSNDGYLLQKFREGISHSNNISTFVTTCVSYFSIVTCVWNIILLCFRSHITRLTAQQFNPKEHLIFNDGVTKITYDEKEQRINISTRKVSPDISITDLARSASVEANERVQIGEKQHQESLKKHSKLK